MSRTIPSPTLKRLPMYYRELYRANQSGIHYLNSSQLGKALSIPSTQVRKDLSHIEEQGRPGVGYNTRSLANTLRNFLGLPLEKKAVLVGVGNLANALVLFPGLAQCGIHILFLFDNDPTKIGKNLADCPILDVSQLSDIIRQESIPIGIITTPAAAAQQVADQMTAAGVKSIWNFAPITVQVPPSVYVLNHDMSVEMAILSYSTLQQFQQAP